MRSGVPFGEDGLVPVRWPARGPVSDVGFRRSLLLQRHEPPMPRAALAPSRRARPAQLAPPAARQAATAPLLPPGLLERLLAEAMARGADFAEVYVERTSTT